MKVLEKTPVRPNVPQRPGGAVDSTKAEFERFSLKFEPLHIDKEVLDGFFEGRSENFITYHGLKDHDPRDLKIRIDGKFIPTNSKVGVPKELDGYRKTALIQPEPGADWERVQDRVDMREL